MDIFQVENMMRRIEDRIARIDYLLTCSEDYRWQDENGKLLNVVKRDKAFKLMEEKQELDAQWNWYAKELTRRNPFAKI